MGRPTLRVTLRRQWRVRRGFAIALAASIALHLALSLLRIEPSAAPDAEPLQATIRELPPPPKPVVVAVAKPKAKARRAASPAPPRVALREPAPIARDETPALIEATPEAIAAGPELPAVPAEIADAAPAPPGSEHSPDTLPPRVDLVYKGFLGTHGFEIGNAVYRFEHHGNDYRISTIGKLSRLLALFFPGEAKLESRGLITSAGLQPLEFSFERTSRQRREVAQFDWEAGMVTLQDQQTAALELPTFDALSIMWQYYFTPPPTDEVSFSLATTRRLRRYTVTREAKRRSPGARARSTPSAGTAAARTAASKAMPGSRPACITFRSRSVTSVRGHLRGAAGFDSRRRTARAAMTLRANQLASLAAAIADIRPLAAPADTLLHQFFRRHPAIGQQDRAFVADGVFAYLRRRRSLEALAADGRTVASLALAVATRELGRSVRELESVLKESDALWLRAFKSRLATELAPAVAADLPDWLWVRLGDAYGDDERALLARAWQAPAPLDLRVNPLKTNRDAARAALAAVGNRGEGHALLSARPARRRDARRSRATRCSWMARSKCRTRAASSSAISSRRKRTDMVVDFCAGAGGKTLLLGALMRSHGRLYAFDIVEKRLANLKPRLARSGLSNVHPQLLASERDAKIKRLAGKIDRVLVDAPCTGFGTLRRNPDLKWRQAETAVAELARKQQAILAAAATLVKPGGRLVYATCSVLPEENEAVVDAFLAAHSQFARGNAAAELARAGIALDTGPMLKLLPHRHGCDGFFAAVLERKSAPATS